MGVYLDPGNIAFGKSLSSEIYVDKTGLIEYTNKVINTRQQYICVSRPRRFGKTMAAEMLAAYYSIGADSEKMFEKLTARKLPTFYEHLNKHHVIALNMQQFLSGADNVKEMTSHLTARVMRDLKKAFSDIAFDEYSLADALTDIYADNGNKGFIFIIDEWDCIFRENKDKEQEQRNYLDFLRNLLKDRDYVELVYMTGILPIKKYGSHSALNMFTEISMTRPEYMAEYMGFTENEVRELCIAYGMDFSEAQRWYDGYMLGTESHIYSPKSVVDSMLNKQYQSYWTMTETYEALKIYIELNIDGLRTDIVSMLAGIRCKADISSFSNDMTTFDSKDDVFALLIHLGYLSYDRIKSEVFIPNEEIRSEYMTSIKVSKWNEVIRAVTESDKMLEALLCGDADVVADGIEKVHTETTSILTYNNENSLSCVVSLAFYSARNSYILAREFPAGKGFADIVFVPRKNSDKPAIVVELKWDKNTEGAISQIKEKKYCDSLKEYAGDVILAGINYDKATKKHSCVIEKYCL